MVGWIVHNKPEAFSENHIVCPKVNSLWQGFGEAASPSGVQGHACPCKEDILMFVSSSC